MHVVVSENEKDMKEDEIREKAHHKITEQMHLVKLSNERVTCRM